MYENPKCRWAAVVWNPWSIPKHAILAWLISKESLNTKVKLLRIGVCDEANCCICDQEDESIDHLFYQCIYSTRLIQAINEKVGVMLPGSRIIDWCKSRRGSKIQRRVQIMVAVAAAYHIWFQRNQARVEGKLDKPDFVAQRI
ncbi:uncharacterized protein LOC141601613 [Silene latifolia]|uniref:uncharacterized protein LOC141601613 n=1 Tax=Silene latifolia TaxID=37657 RepID=UPI003D775D97